MRTLIDALDWAREQVGKKGLPQSWAPRPANDDYNDCCWFATEAVGSTVGTRLDIRNGSIRAFRSHRDWREGDTPKRGALVLLRWSDEGDPDHIGIVHTVYADGSVGTYEANTGPRAGVPQPRGVYSRRRYPVNIVGYVYPPYKVEEKTPARPHDTYTVKKGDTLTSIAESHSTSVAKLVKLNSIKDPDVIHAGQKLKLN